MSGITRGSKGTTIGNRIFFFYLPLRGIGEKTNNGIGPLKSETIPNIHEMYTMRETKLAQEFSTLFGSRYPIFVMVNKTQGGWPDRGIQLSDSRICFVELKVSEVRQGGTFRLSNFRADQAAFMAKWKRRGGLCFLLVMIGMPAKTVSYGVIEVEWREWVKVNQREWRPGELTLFTSNKRDIVTWAEQYFKAYIRE